MSERIESLIEIVRTFDSHARIVGSFVLRSTAFEEVLFPKEIAKSFINLEVPIRYPDEFKIEDAIYVDYHDLILSLLIQHNEPAADYFEPFTVRTGRRINYPGKFFSASDGDVGIDSPVSTDAYYRYLQQKYRQNS